MSLTHGGNIFALAQEHGWDWREVLDFSASINPLGPSPSVRNAVVQHLDRIVHYPERNSSRLAAALAAIWNVGSNQILLGNGATELIYFLARTLQPHSITLAQPVFSEFHRAFPHATFADLHDLKTWPRDRILVLTRPANPLGSTIPLATLSHWLAKTSNPVLIDESFIDFSAEASCATLLAQRPGLMILRSLTKFYALPGLRIGALIGNDQLAATWRRSREPWQVNVLAEEAALAAVADREHAARTLEYVASERQWLSDQLQSLGGVTPCPSDANFLYARLSYPAADLQAFLLPHKLILRVCTGWPGLSGEAVRIAVRTHEENQTLLHHWRRFSCA